MRHKVTYTSTSGALTVPTVLTPRLACGWCGSALDPAHTQCLKCGTAYATKLLVRKPRRKN